MREPIKTRDSGLIGYGAEVMAVTGNPVLHGIRTDEASPDSGPVMSGSSHHPVPEFSHELKNLFGSNTSFLLSMK